MLRVALVLRSTEVHPVFFWFVFSSGFCTATLCGPSCVFFIRIIWVCYYDPLSFVLPCVFLRLLCYDSLRFSLGLFDLCSLLCLFCCNPLRSILCILDSDSLGLLLRSIELLICVFLRLLCRDSLKFGIVWFVLFILLQPSAVHLVYSWFGFFGFAGI